MSLSKRPFFIAISSVVGLLALSMAFQNCAQPSDIAEQDLVGSKSSSSESPSANAIDVTSIYPTSSVLAGGVQINIYGKNFQATDTVTVGGVACPGKAFVSPVEIDCIAPPMTAAGNVSIVVARADQSAKKQVNGFSYIQPPADHVPCAADSTLKHTLNAIISFPSTGAVACNYGTAVAKPGYAVARGEYISRFSLPSNAVICDGHVSVQNADFMANDHFILSLNNRVLATSSSALIVGLDPDPATSFRMYTWSKVAGVAYNTTPYCAQSGSVHPPAFCVDTPLATAGHRSIHFEPTLTGIKAGLAAVASGSHFFRLTVVGDGTSTDCMHNGLVGSIQITYDTP
jgi:hypothetical protein